MRSMKNITVAFSAAVLAAGIVTAPAANAAPTCPGVTGAPFPVANAPGSLQALTVDPHGRAYTADLQSGRVYRIDVPGATPVTVATVPGGDGAGGLAWTPDGKLLVGYGSDARVIVGDVLRGAGIMKFDPNTGALTPFASGLSAASGLDVAHDGTVYATNDFGTLVARISPNGFVLADWARFPSVNGGVLSRDGRYLYFSRTFVLNPGVSRALVANPGVSESLLDLGGTDVFAAPDDPTLDSADRPIVPFNAGGEVVRIDGPNHYCVLGTGTPSLSVLSYGRSSTGFSAGRLFGATFGGVVYEIPGGFDRNATTRTP